MGLSAYCFASATTWSLYEAWRHDNFTTEQLTNLAFSGDAADPDQDGLNNQQEYRAGTNPTNAASVLVIYSLTHNPAASDEFVVRWQSATGRSYAVQSATNLPSGFGTLTSGIPATPTVNVYTDAVGGAGQKFYRVTVE